MIRQENTNNDIAREESQIMKENDSNVVDDQSFKYIQIDNVVKDGKNLPDPLENHSDNLEEIRVDPRKLSQQQELE